MMAGDGSSTFVGKKVGRTTELRKPEEVTEQLDSITLVASPIEYDTTLFD